jgi:hypothetical protein
MMANWQHLAMLAGAVPDDADDNGVVYIGGPMSAIGPPTWNYPAFHAKAAELRAKGIRVINPAELHAPDPNRSWSWYLRRDLAQLVKCSDLVLLPGWRGSRGAQLEHHVAQALGMNITYPPEDTAT